MRNRFRPDLLPDPATYYQEEGLTFRGTGEWRSTRCPFHDDNSPSLRVRMETGGFICMSCGQRGGDVLAFHQKRHGLGFKETARALGAWEE